MQTPRLACSFHVLSRQTPDIPPPPQKRPLLNLRLFASCDVGWAWELDPELELPGRQPLDSLPSRSDTSDRLRPSLDKASFSNEAFRLFCHIPRASLPHCNAALTDMCTLA